MFIHIGGEMIVRTQDVIVIIDISKQDQNQDLLQSYLQQCAEKQQLIYITDESIKSIVVTTDKVYASPISSLTLNRRNLFEQEERGEHA